MKTTQYVRLEKTIAASDSGTGGHDDLVCRLWPEAHPACQQRIAEEADRMWRKLAPGYLYVVEFAPNRIKVGRTDQPAPRLASHARHAAAFGAEIRRSWVSKRHAVMARTERELIALCTKQGEPISGREYFALSFETARTLASIAVRNSAWDDGLLAEVDALAAHERLTGEGVPS